MFQLKWPKSLGVVKNWFSRWQLWRPFWISDRHDFSYILFIYKWICCYIVHVSFNFICLVDCKKMSKTDFQDGSCGGHLRFLINMILAHFNPEVVLLLQSKFRLKLTKGLGWDVKSWFSRWRFWRPSWIFNRLIYTILCLLGAPMLLVKFQLNRIIAFRGNVQNMNSQHFSHINVKRAIQMHGEANLTLP